MNITILAGSKQFFSCFISKCAEKKVMPICKVITKSNVFICSMIPSEEDHGFYMLKTPFSGKQQA